MQEEKNKDVSKGPVRLYTKGNITVEQQLHPEGMQVVLYENDKPKQDTLYFFVKPQNIFDVFGEYENRKYDENGKVIYGEHYYPKLGCIEIRHYDGEENLNQKTVSIYPDEKVKDGSVELQFILDGEERLKMNYPNLRKKYTTQITCYHSDKTIEVEDKRSDKQLFEHAQKEINQNNLKKLVSMEDTNYNENYYKNLLG